MDRKTPHVPAGELSDNLPDDLYNLLRHKGNIGDDVIHRVADDLIIIHKTNTTALLDLVALYGAIKKEIQTLAERIPKKSAEKDLLGALEQNRETIAVLTTELMKSKREKGEDAAFYKSHIAASESRISRLEGRRASC